MPWIWLNHKNDNAMSWKSKLGKFGLVAFLFFFIKGLVWIAIFLGLGKYVFG